MKKTIDNLIELAKQYRSFSQETKGWSIEYYYEEDLEVRCYFASESNYTSVQIDEFQVSFHTPISITIRYDIFNEKSLEELYIRATKFLKHLKLENKKRTKKEIEEEKTKRKEVLLKELESLN